MPFLLACLFISVCEKEFPEKFDDIFIEVGAAILVTLGK